MVPLARKVALGKVVASRRFKLRGKPRKKVELRIGTPRNFDGDAYCPVQLVGVGDERIKPVYGVDRLQALSLAMKLGGVLVKRYGRRLTWDGAPAGETFSPQHMGRW